jgi:hypothetical protein
VLGGKKLIEMKLSKNVLSQALKIVKPDITKAELFKLIEVPACLTTTTRYWLATYDIKPWEDRSREERIAALKAAKEMISDSLLASDADEAHVLAQ